MIDLSVNRARVVFSDRRGGVSSPPYDSLNLGILTDDDQARVLENRLRLATATGRDPDSVAMGWQVHGDEILEWAAPPQNGGFAHPGAELPKVDGHTTRSKDVPLLVLVADCLPVALVGGGRVTMLHCGWRGLAAGIIERALERFDEPPHAVLGPCIGPCCYEVGDEVLNEFSDLSGIANGRMLSLQLVAQQKLLAKGVAKIDSFPLCTSCRPDLFFSHRRDGGVTGRQAGLVWLT
ncbi:MAG TPA: polyphenol oxidase family protein [Thermoleophilaceae bacterium]|nr:polyphenol oxidase family protein [Thermoleophilaceae bacterium]